MLRLLPFLLIASLLPRTSAAQATFTTISGGNWNDAGIWLLQSGSSSVGYPVAGDTVTISGGYIVTATGNSQCGQLAINSGSRLELGASAAVVTVSNGVALSAGSALLISQGAMNITGTFSVTGASSVVMSQGALTVIGLVVISAPAAPGKTLVDINGGIFTSAGGLSITGINATRQAELRINSSAVNVVGSLITATANALINFTGSGTLTLAGLINISDPSGFIAGTGRVIYVGIPGTEQVIAPLNYYRLTIAGTGNGIKKIQGPVHVSDTLTLINDTLLVDGGQLNIADNATLVRTAGKMMSPPAYAGRINILYNNFIHDTTGYELPVNTTTLQDLSIDNNNGVHLAAPCTVNGVLKLLNGSLNTEGYLLTLSQATGGSSANDPAIERTNGYVRGRLARRIDATTGLRVFPFGTSSGAYREWSIQYTTAPSSPGLLTVEHTDSAAPAQSGLPLMDSGVTISSIYPVYWQATANEGLSGGMYSLQLTGEEIAGITSPFLLRIAKRSGEGDPWTIQGAAGANSGTADVPVVTRTGMSDFSQFALGQGESAILAVHFLSFKGQFINNKTALRWSTANETNSRDFTVLHSTDGIHFSPLAIVPAAGVPVTVAHYTFDHTAVLPGLHYYRIRQNDIDDHATYSSTVIVKVESGLTPLVLPTLAVDYIYIANAGSRPARLYNPGGNYLRSLWAGRNYIGDLAPGLYYVEKGGLTGRFLKLK